MQRGIHFPSERICLVNKIIAIPPVGLCCCEYGVDNISKNGFKHINKDKTKNCNGIYYLGNLQNKKVVVCSECRLVQQFKDVYWECPNCLKIFKCKKRKEKKIIKKVNNIEHFNILLKEDKSSIFQPKKIHSGFYKSEKRKDLKENNFYSQEKHIINNFKILKKLESNNSGEQEPILSKIISKKIKPKNIKKNNINLAKININKSNNDNDEDTADENRSPSEGAGDNFSSEKNKNKII